MASSIWLTPYIICVINILYLSTSDTSVPVGQNPSIVYAPNSYRYPGAIFSIYNSAQGLESIYCDDSNCEPFLKQTLKCDVKLYASSLIAIDPKTSHSCSKHVAGTDGLAGKQLHCTYYIVIGYGSLTAKQNTNSISFIICYDKACSKETMDEIVIETSFSSDPLSKTFGSSISLATYNDLRSQNRYPMFTYSKYSHTLKQFILNVIICKDFYCRTWVGKPRSSFASNPPYVTLGIKPGGAGSVGKGSVAIQETYSSETNFVTVMFCRNVNITNNGTILYKNVYVLVVGTCGVSSSKLVDSCDSYGGNPSIGKELNSTVVSNIYGLKTNTISMIQYYPSSGTTGLPLFITAYIMSTGNGNINVDELWLLYCFNIFCNSANKMYYGVRRVKTIDFPQIFISSQPYYLPHIIFFENSSSLMSMSCNYGSATWNCTDLYFNHPTQAIVSNGQFETISMQISVSASPYTSKESLVVFSQVMDQSGSGGGIFNGSVIINCQDVTCKVNSGPIYLLKFDLDNDESFSTSFDITVFVILLGLVSFISIFGIFAIYKFISPSIFISKNIRNAYLAKVSLDHTRIRPLSYWFFCVNLICSAMCIIPWFAYFDTFDYWLVIIPPFTPVILTLCELFVLHTSCPSSQMFKYFNFYISILYYLSTILVSYSFSFVWKLKSENCQTSDLSGLRIIILVGHIATLCVVEYFLFWNVKCFQALKLASPENIKEPINHHSNANRNSESHKIMANSRLLAAVNDGQ